MKVVPTVKQSIIPVALLVIATALATPASAVITTFASFTAPTADSFVFTNTGTATSGFVLSPTPANVTFNYTTGISNGYGPANTPIAARMTFSATVNGFGTVVGPFTEQPLQNIVMSINAVTPVNGMTNLLSFTAATGTAFGRTGSGAFSLTIDTGLGNTLVYNSAFVAFPNSVERELNFGFTSSVPTFQLAGASGSSYLRSLNADGNGNFAADPQPIAVMVPEAGTIALTATGLMLLGGMVLRRRK
ncbi:MAG: PEP-CTERM sorting domain-containing protein [Armatimonadetes bacterium]|nr:PEP-CTERM sorting domain-containing protein [Armatimonadota bacterium]